MPARVTPNQAISLSKTNLTGGHITSTSAFTLTTSGLFTWSKESTLGGNIRVQANGGATINGTGNKLLSGASSGRGFAEDEWKARAVRYSFALSGRWAWNAGAVRAITRSFLRLAMM